MISHVFCGFSFIASRTALDFAHVFDLLSHRFLIAFLLMSAVMVIKRIKLNIKGNKRAFLLVMLELCEPVIYFFGEQYGILHSSTIFSGVMIAVIPIVSILAAAPILKERPTVGQLVFSVVSVAGVIGIGLMTRSRGSLDLIGVAALTIAVLAVCAYTLLGRGISKEFTAFERTYMMLAVGAVVFTILAAFRCNFSIAAYIAPFLDVPYLISSLFLGVCCSSISYFLVSYAITYLSVAQATVFANLTTAVSVFAGAVLLKEPFSWLGLAFCAMILPEIYGVQRSARSADGK
ncbi:MAG: DMT family transporter [Clostridia bacterium]|nr:DMT family transporter [Clostridia bacterium]